MHLQLLSILLIQTIIILTSSNEIICTKTKKLNQPSNQERYKRSYYENQNDRSIKSIQSEYLTVPTKNAEANMNDDIIDQGDERDNDQYIWNAGRFSSKSKENNKRDFKGEKKYYSRNFKKTSKGNQRQEHFLSSRETKSDEVAPPFWSSRGHRGESSEEVDDDHLVFTPDLINEHYTNNLPQLKYNPNVIFKNPKVKDYSMKNKLIPKRIFNDNKMKFPNNDYKPFEHISTYNEDETPRDDIMNSRTVHQDELYAAEPYYILVDRASRSIDDDDPYFITRGKKINDKYAKLVRKRRGIIDKILGPNDLRMDPYYPVRGKKAYDIKILLHQLCEKLRSEYEKCYSKREIGDKDRERRTLLREIAAQLSDPYYVTRGKRKHASIFGNYDNHCFEYLNIIY